MPVPDRQRLLEAAFKRVGEAEPPNEWIMRGQLSHKSQQVFEALLSSYDGSYAEVLKHVQVERYFISRRYRVGAVTIGPQLSVDAAERQVTMDRSLQSLPASLQAVTLYEAKGELVDAAGGVLEFSDLLKRPLDAFKYLQLSVETGEVALTAQNVQLNCVMMGSANELHLDAFREHAEFASFRGRLELARVPYLRSYEQERLIYDTHVAPHVRRHVAPHATEMAALFAVFTRMRKPNPDRYSRARRRDRVDADRRREGGPLRAGQGARAARRRDAEGPAGGHPGGLGRERLVPHLRGPRRREPSRDARRRCSTRRSRLPSSASTRSPCSTRSRPSARGRTSSSGSSKTRSRAATTT